MEYFLLSTRIFTKDLLRKNCFDDSKVCDHAKEILLRLVIGYTIITDALAPESNPLWPAPSTCHPREAGLCRKLKDKCLALHQRYYPWMLDLRLMNLEQVIKEQKEKEKDKHAAGVLVHHGNDTILDQNYHNSINLTLGSLPQTSARAVYEHHLIGMTFESEWNHPTTISFSTDLPSFLLLYRLYTAWPLTTALSYQATRPCSALASPQKSHNLEIRFSDFHLWRLKQRQDPNTCFQPSPSKIIFKEGFECGLPNKINVGEFSFKNSDGGVPKSVIEDCGFKDQWEWGCITEILEKKRRIGSVMLERPMLAESTR